MRRKPAEFFLETWTYKGRYILTEPLTAPDLAGLTLLGCSRKGCDRLLEEASEMGLSPQRILSAISPEETAGMLLPERKLAVCTARKIDMGLLPGVCERELPQMPVRLTADQKAQLKELRDRIGVARGRTGRMLRAARELLRENEQRQQDSLDKEKVVRTAERLFRKECGSGRKGTEQKRFLTALTGKGFYACSTLPLLCDRAILLEDPFGGAAGLFMAKLREMILAEDQGCITCLDPLEPERIAHLILPELRLCFVTVSPLLPVPALPEQRRSIHFTRFCSTDLLEEHRQKIRFTRRMAAELLREAESAAAEAAGAEKLSEEYLPDADDDLLLQPAREQMR